MIAWRMARKDSDSEVYSLLGSRSLSMCCVPRLREAGSGFRHRLDDQGMAQVIEDTCHVSGHGRATGFRVIQAALSARSGVRVPRSQVLRVQAETDPDAHQARRERVIHRRMYDVHEAMVAWHIDCEPLIQDAFLPFLHPNSQQQECSPQL